MPASKSIYDQYLNGELNSLNEKGLLKSTVFIYCEIYRWYLLHRAAKFGYDEAIFRTSQDSNVSVSTVKRAISLVSKN